MPSHTHHGRITSATGHLDVVQKWREFPEPRSLGRWESGSQASSVKMKEEKGAEWTPRGGLQVLTQPSKVSEAPAVRSSSWNCRVQLATKWS